MKWTSFTLNSLAGYSTLSFAMTTFLLAIYFTLMGGFMLLLGNSSIPKEVKEALPPEDLEMMQQELDSWRYVGQLVLVVMSFVLILWLMYG